MYFLFVGSRGGETRVRIVSLILRKPLNANQIASSLKLDYKTVQHHLKILTENRILATIDKAQYGAIYFLSKEIEGNASVLGEILGEFGKK